MKITDYSTFLSIISRRREPSPIRALLPLLSIPGMLSLGGGFPNPETFPFASFSFTLDDGTQLNLSPSEINYALQYSPTAGYPGLLNFLQLLQSKYHLPDFNWGDKGRRILITTGSQDALTKCFEMIMDPGDSIFLEDSSYPGALVFLKAFGANFIPLRTDHHGIIPSFLESTLKALRSSNKPIPKLLYCIPTSQNPSGSTIPLPRKQEIYKLASQYNFLILEDDPYFHMSTNPSNSFLSIDSDYRVIRFDSLSKSLSSGLRIGWATGPSALMDSMELHLQAVSIHASGLSQVVAMKLMENWGLEGWETHCVKVKQFYLKRRNLAMDLVRKHLGDLVELNEDSDGMFLWLRVKQVEDSKKLVDEKARDAKVLLLPGQVFSPCNEVSSYVRLCFSMLSEQDLEIAIKRFAGILKH